VNVQIIENGTTTRFAANNFSGYGSQARFGLEAIRKVLGRKTASKPDAQARECA